MGMYFGASRIAEDKAPSAGLPKCRLAECARRLIIGGEAKQKRKVNK